MLGDLSGAFSVPTVRIGETGLFNALHEDGPGTADELAKRVCEKVLNHLSWSTNAERSRMAAFERKRALAAPSYGRRSGSRSSCRFAASAARLQPRRRRCSLTKVF